MFKRDKTLRPLKNAIADYSTASTREAEELLLSIGIKP
jgi:hypothetical protein